MKVTITSTLLLCDNKEGWRIVLIVGCEMTLGPPIRRLTLGFSDVYGTLCHVVNPQHFPPMRIRLKSLPGLWSDFIFPVWTSSSMVPHHAWILPVFGSQGTFMDNLHLAREMPIEHSQQHSATFCGQSSGWVISSRSLSNRHPCTCFGAHMAGSSWGWMKTRGMNEMCSTSIFPKQNLPKRLGWIDLYTEFERSMLWLFPCFFVPFVQAFPANLHQSGAILMRNRSNGGQELLRV